MATPGHSAGSIAVTAATAGGTAVIAGDTIQNATVARERKSALVFWNSELATMSITKLMSIGDIIYPGHDLPFRPGLGGKAEYLHEMELTLTSIEAGQPGLVLQPDGEKVVQTIMSGIEEQRLSDLPTRQLRAGHVGNAPSTRTHQHQIRGDRDPAE